MNNLMKLLQLGIIAFVMILGFAMSYLKFYKSSLKTSKYRQQLHVYRGMFDSRLSKPVAFCSEQNKKQPVLHNRGKLKFREHEVKAFRCKVIPDILVVGMEKCGTTTLRTFLGIYPQIFVPLPLEVKTFFSHQDLRILLYQTTSNSRRNETKP